MGLLNRLCRPPRTAEQRTFYDDLASGGPRWTLFSFERRFSARVALESPSFRKHFVGLLAPLLDGSERMLDLGCGTGMYLPLVAPLCRTLVGAELSTEYARMASETIAAHGLSNTAVVVQDGAHLAFPAGSFDAALCVDSLHHVEHLDATLRELARVLRPGGKVFVFEPNAVNPLLFAMFLIDRNEWGALGRCRLGRYRRVFERHFEAVRGEPNGLVIAPKGRLTRALADFLASKSTPAVLRDLSPKLFFHMRSRRLRDDPADPPSGRAWLGASHSGSLDPSA